MTKVDHADGGQTLLEGRYLGGRPPYGYTLKDLGSHPNPAKAADGKRLHGLTPDPDSAPVVQRIFAMYLAGYGMFAIAEALTRDDIPCPSAYDRARNPHRDGLAWSKGAVRVILTNPRYTGRQAWNKQRTDEVLLNVNDVALGHTAVMRWNPRDKWVTSKDLTHEPLVDQADFDRAQTLLTSRARTATAPKRAHRSRHPYIFKSLIFCGICLFSNSTTRACNTALRSPSSAITASRSARAASNRASHLNSSTTDGESDAMARMPQITSKIKSRHLKNLLNGYRPTPP